MADILIIRHAVVEVGAVLCCTWAVQVVVQGWSKMIGLVLCRIVSLRCGVDPSSDGASDDEKKDNDDHHKQDDHSHRYDDDNKW